MRRPEAVEGQEPPEEELSGSRLQPIELPAFDAQRHDARRLFDDVRNSQPVRERSGDRDEEPEGDEDANYGWRQDFQRELAEGGWAAVHWPVQYGGRGATMTESAIFFEELGRSGSPLPANVLGLLLAGPTIMTWGSAEQKERYLTPILTAEEIWCQGFS